MTVLIVGAGPVGVSAALSLSRAGIEVRVVDANLDVDRRMRASTFHPPTLDIAHSLGVGEELLASGLKASHYQLRQHESGEYVRFDLELIRDATSHPYRLQIEQHKYCDLVIQALSKLGINIEFGSRLQGLEQGRDSVSVHLENVAAPIECEWVIGADGANSAVRNSLGLNYGGKTYTHSSVLISTRFPFETVFPDLDPVTYCWSDRGPFSLLQLRGLWRASLYPGVEDLDQAANENRVRDWLAYIHPDARDAEILDINPYRVHERCVDQFRVGRVFLAGDAAHLNPPSGGMGMNGGIHDAMNLTDKLIHAISNGDDKWLDNYHRQRHTLASQRIIPQASANRERMATMDRAEQMRRLQAHREISEDVGKCREFLLRNSMIAGLREAQGID